MNDLTLSCQCGQVKGVASNVTQASCIRVVCYCSGCQAFAKTMGAEDRVLNEYGGTDITQVAPANMHVSHGQENIACLRLSEKGAFRWYARCCNTPIANSAKPSFPFIGLIHTFIDMAPATREAELGPVLSHCQTRHATDDWPSDLKRNGFPISLTFKVMRTVMGWKIRGLGNPNPFFSDAGEPVVQPSQLRRGHDY